MRKKEVYVKREIKVRIFGIEFISLKTRMTEKVLIFSIQKIKNEKCM